MDANTKNYGYIPDEIQPQDYLFGGENIPDEILQPDGDWTPFLPKDEFQFKGNFDTQNCTVFAALNAIEILMKRKYAGEYNYSERFLGIMAGTTPQGNSPHKVAETIRKVGLIEDKDLPFDDSVKSWEQYYSPKPMIQRFIDKALQWLSQIIFKHDWVFKDDVPNKAELLLEALKRAPLVVSVYAWMYGEDCYIKPQGVRDNHNVVLVSAIKGKRWIIFDQYDKTVKELAWDYNFDCAKRYYITKKLTDEQVRENLKQQVTLYQRVVELLKKLLFN